MYDRALTHHPGWVATDRNRGTRRHRLVRPTPGASSLFATDLRIWGSSIVVGARRRLQVVQAPVKYDQKGPRGFAEETWQTVADALWMQWIPTAVKQARQSSEGFEERSRACAGRK